MSRGATGTLLINAVDPYRSAHRANTVYGRICVMGKYEKLLLKITSGKADANIEFEELRNLLKHLGFEDRTKGSHHIFRKESVAEKINIQQDGSKAKPYQVKQVRSIIVKYKLGG